MNRFLRYGVIVLMFSIKSYAVTCNLVDDVFGTAKLSPTADTQSCWKPCTNELNSRQDKLNNWSSGTLPQEILKKIKSYPSNKITEVCKRVSDSQVKVVDLSKNHITIPMLEAHCTLTDDIFGSKMLPLNPENQSCWQSCTNEYNNRRQLIANRDSNDLSSTLKRKIEFYPKTTLNEVCEKVSTDGITTVSINPSTIAIKVGNGVNVLVSELEDENLGYNDINFFKEHGITRVRMRVKPEHLFTGKLESFNETYLKKTHSTIQLLLSSRIKVILDFHKFLDSVFPVNLGTTEGKERLISAWVKIANEFNRYGPNLYFEPLNEPGLSHSTWWSLQKRIINEIRKVDMYRIIVVGPAGASEVDRYYKEVGENLIKIEKNGNLVNDPNIIYNFHFYLPMIATHQGTTFNKVDTIHARFMKIPWPISSDHAKCINILLGKSGIDKTGFKLTGIKRIDFLGTQRRFYKSCFKEGFDEPIYLLTHIGKRITSPDPNINTSDSSIIFVKKTKYRECLDFMNTTDELTNLLTNYPKKKAAVCQYGPEIKDGLYVDLNPFNASKSYVENYSQQPLNIQYLEDYISKVANWASKNNVKLMANEFGINNFASISSRVRYVNSMTNLFQKYNIDWYLWEYRFNGGFAWAQKNPDTNKIELLYPEMLQALKLK